MFSQKTDKGLLGLTHVWEECNQHGMPMNNPPFQIRADEAGVRMVGESTRLVTMEDLEVLAKVITDAWEKFGHLKPKILNTAGH